MKLLDFLKPVAPEPVAPRPSWPVERTLLCLNCERVYQMEGDQACPSCASREALAIGRALNRKGAA